MRNLEMVRAALILAKKLARTQHHVLQEIFLFGSLARNEEYPKDIDIAVVRKPFCGSFETIEQQIAYIAPENWFRGFKIHIVEHYPESLHTPRNLIEQKMNRDRIILWP